MIKVQALPLLSTSVTDKQLYSLSALPLNMCHHCIVSITLMMSCSLPVVSLPFTLLRISRSLPCPLPSLRPLTPLPSEPKSKVKLRSMGMYVEEGTEFAYQVPDLSSLLFLSSLLSRVDLT